MIFCGSNAVYMYSPNTRLCLSMSDFHPESWNPSWSLSTILTGVMSFMVEDTPTTGAVETTTEEKLSLALSSLAWNKAQEEVRFLLNHGVSTKDDGFYAEIERFLTHSK